MNGWRIAICLILLLIVQSSLLPFLDLPLARPDLLLLLTLYVGLSTTAERATLTGFFAGVAQDAASGEIPGLNSFAKSLVGFLSPSVRRSFLVANLFVQLLAVALLSTVHALLLYWLSAASQQKAPGPGTGDFLSGTVWPHLASNAIFWVLLRPVLRRALPVPEEEEYSSWRRR